MLKDLQRVLDRNPEADAADLRQAAAELLARQFLLFEDVRARRWYQTVLRHYDYYDNLLDAFGWTLHRDEELGFVGVVPGSEGAALALRLDETGMVLVARLLFEEGMEAFRADRGGVWVDAEELLARYEALIRRERPKKTRFQEILRVLHRHGLLREGAEDPATGLPRLRLLPTLRVVAGEAVLRRLEALAEGGEEGGE